MKYIWMLVLYSHPLFALNSIAQHVASHADRYIGKPYVLGGNSFQKGVDCSSFVQLLYAQYGIHLPRTAKGQALATAYATIKQLQNVQIGDALYFKNRHGHIHHVAIVTDFDKRHRPIITHAKGEKYGVIKETMSDKYISEFIAAKRFYIHLALHQSKKGHHGKLRPLILK